LQAESRQRLLGGDVREVSAIVNLKERHKAHLAVICSIGLQEPLLPRAATAGPFEGSAPLESLS